MTLSLSLVVPPESVVKLAAFTVPAKLVVPLLLAVIAPNGVLLPIAPVVTVILPVPAFKVRFRLLAVVLTVFLKVISPAPVSVLKETSFVVRVTGPLKLILSLVVVMLEPILTGLYRFE